jgi:ribonuclease P protein component
LERIQQTFGKENKLKSKIEIEQIFTKKHSFRNYPLTLHINYFVSAHSELKFVISAPKRLFKRAHERNRIKRLMREAIRKNKVSLTHFLEKNNIVLHVFAIYHADKEAKIENIELSIKNLFIKIENEIVSKISS